MIYYFLPNGDRLVEWELLLLHPLTDLGAYEMYVAM